MTTLSVTRPLTRGLDLLLDDDVWRLPWSRALVARSFPAVNVWTDRDAYLVEAEVPGLALDDLDLTVTGNELTIQGSRQDVLEENATYHRRERGVGRFSRVLHLPTEVEADGIEAHLKDGVLSIRLPKAAAVRPRRIEVRSSS